MSDYDDVAAAAHAEYANQCAYEPLRDALRELESQWVANIQSVGAIPRELRLAILKVMAEADLFCN